MLESHIYNFVHSIFVVDCVDFGSTLIEVGQDSEVRSVQLSRDSMSLFNLCCYGNPYDPHSFPPCSVYIYSWNVFAVEVLNEGCS